VVLCGRGSARNELGLQMMGASVREGVSKLNRTEREIAVGKGRTVLCHLFDRFAKALGIQKDLARTI